MFLQCGIYMRKVGDEDRFIWWIGFSGLDISYLLILVRDIAVINEEFTLTSQNAENTARLWGFVQSIIRCAIGIDWPIIVNIIKDSNFQPRIWEFESPAVTEPFLIFFPGDDVCCIECRMLYICNPHAFASGELWVDNTSLFESRGNLDGRGYRFHLTAVGV